MNLFSKIKNMITKDFRDEMSYEKNNSEIQLKIKSRLTSGGKTKEEIKQDIIKENSFFDTLAKIYFQLKKISELSANKVFQVVDVLEDGRVKFIMPGDAKEHPSADEFPSLECIQEERDHNDPFEGYDKYGRRAEMGTVRMLSKVERNYRHFLRNKKVYILSKNEFDEFTETRFNNSFFQKWNKMNELYKSKELEEAMLHLIPQYEISFNTILNVLNAHIEKKPEKKLSASMEDKILIIFKSFDKKVLEVEQKKKEIKLLEDEGFEKSLEELLDFELKVIEKNEQVQQED